jgi:hypothetical protein
VIAETEAEARALSNPILDSLLSQTAIASLFRAVTAHAISEGSHYDRLVSLR